MADKSVSNESFATQSQAKFSGKKLRVAVVGCGGISGVHIRTLKSFPDVELVAGVDIKPERLTWAQEQGIPKVYKDWNKMLKEIKPDAVDICTPNGVHAPAAIDASKAGCHVLTEKPMAMNPAECQKMIAAAKKAGKVLTVGFQYRYHPSTQFLRRARDEGQFGKIMFTKCQALRRRGIPNWGVFGQKKLQGGGPMIDIGVHVMEMAHYVLGSPRPVAATGNTWTYMGNKACKVECMWPNWDYKTYTVEDLAIGHIRFEDGSILQVEASFAAHVEKEHWNFQMFGEKGGCTWDPAVIYTDRAGTMVDTKPSYLSKNGFDNLFGSKLRNWVDACTKGTKTEAPGEHGQMVQKMIDGVYRSAAQGGKEVKIS